MDACGDGVSAPDETLAAYGEVVWSWRRDPGATLAVSPAGYGGKKGRSPGRSRNKPSNIARARPGCLGCTCQSRVPSFYPLHMAMRAQSAPGLPCALSKEREQRIAELRRKS